MAIINAFNGVANDVLAAGASWTLRVPAAAAAAAAAHPAHMAHAVAGAAAVIAPRKRRRTAAATRASVDRSLI